MTDRQRQIVATVGEMAALKYFPSDEHGRAAIMKLLDRMAGANYREQLNWLSETLMDNYTEWPGPHEIRAIFCTRFKPADGIEADLTAGRLAAKIEARALEAHQAHKQLAAPAEALSLVKGVKGLQ